MKTLIYTLSTTKCGTRNLSQSLANIGINAYHEHTQINHLIYGWTNGLFCDNIDTKILLYREEFTKILLSSFENNYYADISNRLSWFYPIINTIKDIQSRCIHITRDPRRMLGEFIGFSRYGDKFTKSLSGKLYPPNLCELYGHYVFYIDNRFAHWCLYWCHLNEYFSKCEVPHFKVEDFNDKAIEIVDYLYPEASRYDKAKFALNLLQSTKIKKKTYFHYTEWSKEQVNMYNELCGPSLDKYGYERIAYEQN